MDNETAVLEVLNGIQNTKEFTFDMEGQELRLELRPLREGELLKLQMIENGNQKGKVTIKKGMSREEIRDEVENQTQDMEFNIKSSELIENVAYTKYKAIELSAGLSQKTINLLSRDVIDEIFDQIMDLSKITEDDLNTLKEFRKNRKR